jgi:hypothetical protein
MFGLLVTLALVAGTTNEPIYLLGRGQGFMVLNPEVACESFVTQAQWSSNGKYLVLQRERTTMDRKFLKQMVDQFGKNIEPPRNMKDPIENTLVVWNNETKTSRVIWHGPASSHQISTIQVTSKTAYFVATVTNYSPESRETDTAQYVMSASLSSGDTRVIRALPQGNFIALFEADNKTNSLLVCEVSAGQGLIAPTSAVPPPPLLSPMQNNNEVDTSRVIPINAASLDAQPSGQRIVPKQSLYLVNAGGVRPINAAALNNDFIASAYSAGGYFRAISGTQRVAYNINEGTGELTKLNISAYNPPKPPEEIVKLSTRVITIEVQKARKPTSVLVASDPETGSDSVVISPNVGLSYGFAPDQSSMFYVVDGIAIVRDLIAVDAAVLRAARDAAQQAALVSNAKQCGLALLMYSVDNDDILPAGMTGDQMMPYLRDGALLDGFVYTFGGGNLNQLDRIAETELGYVQGGNGRAVIYADGHVTWKPKS